MIFKNEYNAASVAKSPCFNKGIKYVFREHAVSKTPLAKARGVLLTV